MKDNHNEGGRRERKKEKNRQVIVDAAMDLFKKQGFEATTMEQIAGESDVAKGTLYNHFPSKEAIIGEYMHHVVRDNQDRLEGIINDCTDTRSRLLTLLKTLSRWNEENRDIVRMHTTARLKDLFIFQNNHSSRKSNLEIVLTRIVLMGQEAGELRKDFDAGKLARYFKAIYIVPFFGWMAGEDLAANDQTIRETIDIFLNGTKMSGGGGDERK